MEDDIDIYEDLPSFDAKESEKYKEEIKDLSQKCDDFQKENTELKLKVAELLDNNKSLSVNLSSLLKTAKAEISRKDRMITELRQQVDNMAFRRTGYSKPKAQEFRKKPAKNSMYSPYIQQEPVPVHPEPVPYQQFEEEIEDPEQKYEPEKIATTVFGERLRKKILIEQELERAQKEEAKSTMLENEVTTVKNEVETIQENGTAIDLVKNEPETVPNNLAEEVRLSIKSNPASNAGSLNSNEEDDRNLFERRELSDKLLGKTFNRDSLFPQPKRRRIEDERRYSDDMRYSDGNAQYENRFDQKSNDYCRNPRNTGIHLSRRRGSNNREDIERDRRAPGERSKSNHRSRSRSADRRYVEKRADRHRTDKYSAYLDTHEKRRDNRLNRINPYSSKFSRNTYDLRGKIDPRIKSKISPRKVYSNYKNSKLEEKRKRERRESPPPAKLRSRSNGSIRERSADKIDVGRSKSSNRFANIWEETSDRKVVVDEFKIEKSPRTSCEKETTNTQSVSSAPLPKVSEKKDTNNQDISSAQLLDVSEKKGTDTQHIKTSLLPDDSASIPKSDETTEDIRKLRKRVKTESKDLTTIETMDRDSKPKLPDVFEKKRTDTQHIDTTLLPDDSVSIPKSDETTEDIRKLRKRAKTESKDLAIIETMDRDSKPKLPDVFEKKRTDTQHIDATLLPDDLVSIPKLDETTEDIRKLHKGVKTKSKDAAIIETMDRDSKPKLPDVFEKKRTDTQHIDTTLLPDDSASIPKLDETTEDIRKLHKGVKTKSKDAAIIEPKDRDSEKKIQFSEASCVKEVTNKQIASSQLSPDTSEKEITNQTLTSTAQLPDVSSSTPKTCEVPEQSKNQLKISGRRTKDSEPTIVEQKNLDSESKLQVSPRKSFEKEVTYKLLVSLEVLPDASKKKVTNQQEFPTPQLPSTSASAQESYEASEILKKRKEARRKSKDFEPTIAKEKNRDPEPTPPITLRKSFEREVKTKQIDSLLPEVSKKDLQNAPNESLAGLASASGSNEVPEEIKRERKGARRKPKDPEASIAEQKNRDTKSKCHLSTRRNSEKEVANKALASSAPLADASKNEVTKQQLVTSAKLPNDSTSADKSSKVPEETKAQRKSTRTKSKDLAVKDQKDRNCKPKPPSTRTSPEKEVTNKKPVITTELPDVSNSASGSRDAPEEMKKQQKSGRIKSKDRKPTVTEEKECHSELKSQSPTKTNSEKSEKNEQPLPYVPTVEDLISKLESDGISDEQKPLNNENTKPVASLQIVLNKVDSPGKWISSVLKNNAEIPSILLESPTDVGSRSFKEEKIENIEKFIQNYQDNDDFCCRSPKRSTEDFECRNKSCESTRSILDTLSMDIDVADSKPEDGVLDNSLISEQLLLESLSTPVKKNNPPLPLLPSLNEMKPPPLPPNSPEEIKQPPLPPNSPSGEIKQPPLPSNSPPEEIKQPPLPSNSPPEEIKQPPLPPNSPPEEIKQPPLPPNSPPEEIKQPPLPSDSPSEEMEIQSLPILPFSGKKQQNPPLLPDEKKLKLPPVPSPEAEKQILPLLPSPEAEKQTLPALPSHDDNKQNLPSFPSSNEKTQNLPSLPSPEENKQNFPPLSSPDEKKQSLAPLPSPEEKKQNFPPLSFPDEKKQNLALLPSPEKKEQTLPSLLSPNKTKRSSLSLSPPNKNLVSLPSFSPPDNKQQSPSHKTDNHELPPSPASDKEKQPISLVASSNDRKQRLLSPHPSPDYKKRRILSSLLSSSEKKEPPSSLLPTAQEKTLAPALEEKTKPALLPVSAPQKKTDQSLSLMSVDKTKAELLVQPTPIEENDLPQTPKKTEGPELWAVSVQSQKEDSLPSQVGSEKENSQLSLLPVLTQKDGLSLSLSPVRHEKGKLHLSERPISSKKEDLPPSLLATPTDKINATSSQSPSLLDKKLHSPAPDDKKCQSSPIGDRKLQSSATGDKQLQSSATFDKKLQSLASVDKNPQPPTPVDENPRLPISVDKNQQPPVAVNKKPQPTDKESQLILPVDKTKPPSASVDVKSQPPGAADKKSQSPIPVDKKSQSPIPVDKKSQPPALADKESLLPAGSGKLNPPLVLTEENLLLSAPTEKKDAPRAPTVQTNKISETKETSIKKPEFEKPRPKKVTLKAISRRHRITCNPIVSRYSRKSRDLVLTDSDASRCVSKSDIPSENEANNNTKIETKTSSTITKEAKTILKQIKTTEHKDITLKKNISDPISTKAKSEKSSAAVNICSTENAKKIKSDIPNETSELQTTNKVNSFPEIIAPTLPNVEIPNSEQPEANSGESQTELESKQETSSNLQNQESNSESEKPICPNTAESQGIRLALKIIASPGAGGDSSSGAVNRKKLLSKEKENQSKQVAKPRRIMVVARRRRPVTLEDSSTATTLVTSAQETNCDRLSKNNNIKNTPSNSEQPELVQFASDPGNKGRKRRSADK